MNNFSLFDVDKKLRENLCNCLGNCNFALGESGENRTEPNPPLNTFIPLLNTQRR